MASWRTFNSRLALVLFSIAAAGGCAVQPPRPQLLFADDFVNTDNWVLETEQPAQVVARDGVLDIDTPAGLTLWFRHGLAGPVAIEFEATAVAAGGPNDQVSDLNVFWMATNHDGSSPLSKSRDGKFAAYNDLLTYYVGLGGNRNTSTRFRRYIGDPEIRPLLAGHDLSGRDALLVANRPQRITLLANGSHVEYRRNDRALFEFADTAPYTYGWFALRTTYSHLRIQSLRIYRMPEK
jgi:Domain of unknown function (DUF6250)